MLLTWCATASPQMPTHSFLENLALKKVTENKHARALRDLTKSLDAAGWNVHGPLTAVKLGGPTVYLYDAETRYRQIVVYAKGALSAIAQKAAVAKIDFQVACDGLHDLLRDLGHQKIACNPDTDTMLKVVTGLYLMGTRIYRATEKGDTRPNYVILRYASADGSPLLRPAGVTTGETMTPSQIEECALRLLEMERIMHPERFVKREATMPMTTDGSPGVPGSSPGNLGRSPPKPRPRR